MDANIRKFFRTGKDSFEKDGLSIRLKAEKAGPN